MRTPACAEMRAEAMPVQVALTLDLALTLPLTYISLHLPTPPYISLHLPEQKVEARDGGDGTYALRWCAEVAGEYELHIAREHAPISGSPYRCYVASGFARPPSDAEALKAALRLLHGEGRAPDGSPGGAAAVVEAQLLCLGSMLPQPAASIRRASAHLCQFPAQYARSAEFFKRAPPVARWTPNPNPKP